MLPQEPKFRDYCDRLTHLLLVGYTKTLDPTTLGGCAGAAPGAQIRDCYDRLTHLLLVGPPEP